MIRVFYSCTAPLYDEKLFASLYARLSPERKSKVDRLHFRKDKNLSLGAAALLDAMLRDCGLTEAGMVYGAGSGGKPFFRNAPELKFSLSHSDEAVMACFSEAEIGCDIEKVRDIDLSIAERFFCPSEYEAILKNESCEQRRDAFFRLWTLKESYVKALGTGLSLAANAFEIDLSGEAATVRNGVGSEAYHFCELDLLPGYKSALCVPGDAGDIELIHVDMNGLIG